MLEFNILEIQRNIEEKRLIWGKKLENFLFAKFQFILQKTNDFLQSKNCSFYSVFFSLIFSLFLRSFSDIGANSGYLLAINSINSITLSEMIMNLLNILAIYLSYLILSKSCYKNEQKNLIILVFSLNLFLNPYWLTVNEFIDLPNFLMLLATPILALLLTLTKNNLSLNFSEKFYYFIIPATLIIIVPANLAIFIQNIYFLISSLILTIIFYNFIQSKKFDFFKNKFSLSLILIFPFLDSESFLQLKQFIIFWWIILPIIGFYLYKKITAEFNDKENIKNLAIKSLYFLIFTFTLFLQILQRIPSYLWIFSVLVTLIFLVIYEKTYQKYFAKFSSCFAITIFFLFSNITASYIWAIKQSDNFAIKEKSPNFLSKNIINYAKKNLTKNDEILILTPNLYEVFPTLNYLSQFDKALIYNDLRYNNNLTFNEIADKFKHHIFNKNVKILFINNFYDGCKISFLEYYFRDKNFKKLFFQNYHFENRIFLSKALKKEKEIQFFATQQDVFDKANLNKSILLYDFTIYVRK